MAKTTKKASTSRASKGAKNKSRSNWLTSKINIRSRKTQLLFTVLTFAVIGGAYFTVKSFAAEVNTGPTTTWSAKDLHCYTGDCSYVADVAKNNTTVLRLGKSWAGATLPEKSYTKNTSIQYCVMAKGAGTLHFESDDMGTGGYLNGSPVMGYNVTNVKVSDTKNYQKVCTPFWQPYITRSTNRSDITVQLVWTVGQPQAATYIQSIETPGVTTVNK